jgi:hypothetical protein
MSFEPIHSARTNVLSWGQISLLGALAKDSYIKVTMNSDLSTASKDAGGYNESVSILADRSATIELTLQAQSAVNVALAKIVASDRRNGTLTVAPLDIQTKGTLYLYDFPECYITKRADEDKSEDMSGGTTVWTFRCPDAREKDLKNFNFNVSINAMINEGVDATISLSTGFDVVL